MSQAVALAQQLAHPFSVAYAFFFQVVLYTYRRDTSAMRERATDLIALSETQGFPFWLGLGRAFRGSADVMNGDSGALGELMEGLALAAETGSQLGAPALMALVAEAQWIVGELNAAHSTIAAGLAISGRTGEAYFDADLYRLDGDLILATGGNAAEAVASYDLALAIAREQGSRFHELRATTSLARLWRDQGKRAEARGLLAPLCAWFTEGFETRDLLDAKTLLEELR
jgi:predicted ATPase